MPRKVAVYPACRNASAGNSLSCTLVSWRHKTSGSCRVSHSKTRGSRFRIELTFQVAIFMGSGSHGSGPAEMVELRPDEADHAIPGRERHQRGPTGEGHRDGR